MASPAPPDPVADAGSPNGYTVEVRRDEQGWTVAIASPDGGEAASRACRDEEEARTYASTVRQHIEWLSESKFREYYRLGHGG
ncbi:MAG: hypothetical protein L0206_10070 [Actinobacteria bacterium]|nr:hypothetical protein [Actinomycetota bacterium]